MKGLVVAILFLTRLPLPQVAVTDEIFARSIRCFPAVGLIVGLIVAVPSRIGAAIDPWTGALLALIAWVAVTGALHLDGLGDIADAAGAAHKDKDRLRAVMADPHVGSFAVVAIMLQLVAKLLLTHALVERGIFLPLLLIPFAARTGPLPWSRMLPSLHHGLAATFRGAVRPVDLAIWATALLAAGWFVPALLAAPVLMFLWGVWLRRRIGGISGDGHGAGIELVESGLLFIALVFAAYR